MVSKKTRLKIRNIHKTTALLLGVQIFFWIGSGIYFSWMPIDTVRGRDLVAKQKATRLDLSKVIDLKSISELDSYEIEEIQLKIYDEKNPIYKIKTKEGWKVFDGTTGISANKKTTLEVEGIAKKDYHGSSSLAKNIEYLEAGISSEFKGPFPAYLASFDDWRATRIYIDPLTGEILARRNNFWRVFDFLWMLHILDFSEREDFNNPILRILSASSLVVIISGYSIYLFSRRKKEV